MEKHGNTVADENQEIGKVHRMRQSPVDDNFVVFLGTHGINWISEDCGGNIRALNSGRKV